MQEAVLNIAEISQSPLRSLRIQQLLLVREINRLETLAAAAAALNITQSAATKNLQSIEAALGARLFERSRAGLKPTAVTQRFLVACERILTELCRAEDDVAGLASGQQGRVRVGALIAATPILLPRALRKVRDNHPDIGVEIVEGTLDVLMPALSRGELDLVVGRLDSRPKSDQSVQQVLYEDDIVFAVREGHSALSRRRLTLASLCDTDWIFPPVGTSLRDELEEAFRDAGVDVPNARIESVALSTNLALVEQMDCVLALPGQVYRVHSERYGLHRLPIKLNTIRTQVGYTVMDANVPNPAARTFIEILKGEATALKTLY